MLSNGARSILGIPSSSVLPSNLGDLYDNVFLGRSYETRFGEGWSFMRRGVEMDGEFDFCLRHRTAQCNFFLDSGFRVYTTGSNPIQIASNFIFLVEGDAILEGSVATGGSRRGFGQFDDFDAFFEKHGEYVRDWPEAKFDDRTFARFLLGPSSVIVLSRFYADEYSICGIEYF